MIYKKLATVFLTAILFMHFQSQAQTVNDVFTPTVKVTWLGIDFSEAKLIGDYEHFADEAKVKSFMNSLNELMSDEREKYDVSKVFEKPTVEYHLPVCQDHNDKLKTEGMYSNNSSDFIHLKPEDISKIISKYDFQKNTGLGLMINVESFDKAAEQASMYITFINLDNKKVLLTERMTAAPSGFGLRNYWAGSIDIVFKQIKKKELRNWRERYQKS